MRWLLGRFLDILLGLWVGRFSGRRGSYDGGGRYFRLDGFFGHIGSQGREIVARFVRVFTRCLGHEAEQYITKLEVYVTIIRSLGLPFSLGALALPCRLALGTLIFTLGKVAHSRLYRHALHHCLNLSLFAQFNFALHSYSALTLAHGLGIQCLFIQVHSARQETRATAKERLRDPGRRKINRHKEL